MPETAILTEGLTRRFGQLTAVAEVDLRVASGQFFGFLGQTERESPRPSKCLQGC
jgi:ABC-type uncharacterized transport system ATPase subunit